MRVIFVDVDGVMRNASTVARYKDQSETRELFDGKAVHILNTVTTRASCSIVVSATMRLEYELPELRNVFARNGVVAEVLDAVPYGPPPGMLHGRGASIHGWLLEHPEVTAFAILDDEVSDMLHLRPWVSHVKNGYFDGGLKGYHGHRALTILHTPLGSSYADAYAAGFPNRPQVLGDDG